MQNGVGRQAETCQKVWSTAATAGLLWWWSLPRGDVADVPNGLKPAQQSTRDFAVRNWGVWTQLSKDAVNPGLRWYVDKLRLIPFFLFDAILPRWSCLKQLNYSGTMIPINECKNRKLWSVGATYTTCGYMCIKFSGNNLLGNAQNWGDLNYIIIKCWLTS